jgi:uncharacterized protein (DUF433 family)
MSVFPSILKKTARLKCVILDEIALQELPPWLPQVRVSELSFCGNALCVLPKELPSMATLTTLRLSRNAIEEIPSVLLDCLQLEHLYLDANRITVEPGTRSGKPCIRGLRITVSDVLEYLAAGMTETEILADFPELTVDDIRACLAFAAERERRLLGSVA